MNEAHVRRLARKHGFALRKSRAVAINANDHGDYRLVDANCTVALGGNFDATLDDVVAFLR